MTDYQAKVNKLNESLYERWEQQINAITDPIDGDGFESDQR